MARRDAWRPGTEWRRLEPPEIALLEASTAVKFDGAAALRAQILFTTAQQGCGCGCGTINLKVDESRVAAAELARDGPVQGEAVVSGGGLILFADGGYLRCLAIHYWTDEPLQLPDVSDIRTYLRDWNPLPSCPNRTTPDSRREL